MDSRKLKHFLAVVEHGTFSEAARAVHLTQSALSRSIRALEDELKAQLFDRGARRARLTVFGELVAERARRIRLEMTQLQHDIELLRGGQEGQLNVGFAPGPAALLLAPFLTHMAQHHSRIKVRTEVSSTTALLENLHAENIDAIVGDGYILRSEKDVNIEPLGDLEAGFVCRAGHPILQNCIIDFSTARQYPMATTTLSSAIIHGLVNIWGPDAEHGKLFTLHCNDLNTLRRVTLASDTLLFGIFAITHHERAGGIIVKVPIMPDSGSHGQYGIARISGRTLSPVLEIFYSFTKSYWVEMQNS